MTRWLGNTILVAALLIFALPACGQKSEGALLKYGQLLYYLENYYFEQVNNDQITEEAIKSVISSLDPHSSYISKEDVKAMNEPLQGNFEGVGVEFAIIRDTLTVVAPVCGGPSEKVGIIAGDKIVEIDGECVASVGLTNEMVFKYLRGEKGTKVSISIIRRGVESPLSFVVTRDKIPINSVDAIYEAHPGVIYIKLGRFAANSTKEIIEGILNLGLSSIEGMILDLRGNSGGYLVTAMEIANFFLEKGETIVYTEGLKAKRMEEHARGNGFFKKGALAILVDEHSASASEIVAGAVQDWDRGVVIGRRTFGKGLVQQMLPLNDGSQLRLTVAHYHTPSGRVIQSPFESGDKDQYYRNFIERYSRGEMFSQDSIHKLDSLKYRTLKEGRVVYGGGGIMPDIFVPIDTTYSSTYYQQLLRQGVVIEFINGYYDSNRERLSSSYKEFKTFNRDFHPSEGLVQLLIEAATTAGIEYSAEDFERSRERITHYMKALLARSLFGQGAFYQILNEDKDEIYSRAIEYIRASTYQ